MEKQGTINLSEVLLESITNVNAGHKVESVSGDILGNTTHALSKPFRDVCDGWIRDAVDLEPYMYMHVT